MKSSTSFVCSECGYESPAFMGKCPECGTWNSLKEIKVPTFSQKNKQLESINAKNLVPKKLREIHFEKKEWMAYLGAVLSRALSLF